MTTPVITAGETMPFRHLVALLYASGIGAVPVIDPERPGAGRGVNADLTAKAGGPPAAPAGPRLELPPPPPGTPKAAGADRGRADDHARRHRHPGGHHRAGGPAS